MPIIPEVGRKSAKTRCLIASLYCLLVLGAVTTVYPFALMAATSLTSHSDWDEFVLVPRYLYDNEALRIRHLSEKNRFSLFDIVKLRYRVREPYEIEHAGRTFTLKYGKFRDLEGKLPPCDLESVFVKTRLADWRRFKAGLPERYKDTYFHADDAGLPLGESEVGFQKFLEKRYVTIEAAAAAIGEGGTTSFLQIMPPFAAYDRHAWYPARDPKTALWSEYRAGRPERVKNVITAKPIYQRFLAGRYGNIDALNVAWGSAYEYFWQIPFESTMPDEARAVDWELFVRKRLPMRDILLDTARCRSSYREFIAAKYGSLAMYNAKTGDDAGSLETVQLSESSPQATLALINWQKYYENFAPIEAIILDTADVRFSRFLRGRYNDVAALNDAWGTGFESFGEVEPPWVAEDYADFHEHRGSLRWNYMTRNYAYVIRAVFLQGRALFNTFVLVTLTVLAQITINPMAAYALSRYRLSYSSKVLIFLLATMAFPPQVTMIPNFLMIRDLGLLNSFGALVLPGLANGYYIFLLKGFFDSLPQELYEAASIDGASEVRMFWMITLPLSTPVLAVIALFAFGTSYGSFLWAFTTCQDPKMWTLMVFLHQFQKARAGAPYLVMASLVIAAIPTAIVFLSAQKVLMKGIVVPTMK